MLQVKDVTKAYGEKKAIDNISFNLNSGDLCALIGPNGSGKSTLIKSMAGIITYDHGDICINGVSLLEDSIEYKKLISYVPDTPYIYDYMTPNLFWNFLLDIYDIEDGDREELILYYSKLFEIYDNINDPISSFSKGMTQKVSLISGFLRSSNVYILDEPFSGLDPNSISELKNLMIERASDGCVVLFSTHLLDVAEKICNRVIGIDGGKVIINESDPEIVNNSEKLNKLLKG